MLKRILLLFIAGVLLGASSCSAIPQPLEQSPSLPPVSVAAPAPALTEETLHSINACAPARPVTREFLLWGNEVVCPDFTEQLVQAAKSNGYSDELFYDLFGQTLHTLYSQYTGETAANIHTIEGAGQNVVLAFTGDINFSDTWENMQVLYAQPNGLADCISAPLMERMRAADILLVNNEFPYSARGEKMPGKQYTFRANPEHAAMLTQMGVDIVSLGNNHVFDYGKDAFFDTLQTLADHGISYVGAGKNLQEAMQPQYFIAGGIKIAYVAASRAEKYILTPEATESTPGVLRTYGPALFLQAVEEAKQNADLVVAYPHWGTENTSKLEDAQIELARLLIDAGADMVVGAHPHCLQGLSFYNGKPIAYSLGNFWFNTDTVDTALLEVEIASPTSFTLRILPCLQRGGKTSLLEGQEAQRILTQLQSYSPNVVIHADGTVAPQ